MSRSFRGVKVVHRKYGTGIIDGDYLVNENDRRIRVQYETGFIGNYIFPEDFINGKLQTKDPELQDELRSFEARNRDEKEAQNKSGNPMSINRSIKHEELGKMVYAPKTVPTVLHDGIRSLFNVWQMKNLPDESLRSLRETCKSFFRQTGETDYSSKAKEYTLCYLPLNMYKCWFPLYTLLKAGKLSSDALILELGAGPGTTTFGTMEFYRYLAEESPEIHFNLSLDLIEIEGAFGDIFRRLFDAYRVTIPSNLSIGYEYKVGDAFGFLNSNTKEYSLILESNMLNANERIVEHDLSTFAEKLKNTIAVNGSLILIEPYKTDLLEAFYVLGNGLDSGNCRQIDAVAAQTVNISSDKLIGELRTIGVFGEKQGNEHHFCYSIFSRQF